MCKATNVTNSLCRCVLMTEKQFPSFSPSNQEDYSAPRSRLRIPLKSFHQALFHSPISGSPTYFHLIVKFDIIFSSYFTRLRFMPVSFRLAFG
jgi:hypothetical protein